MTSDRKKYSRQLGIIDPQNLAQSITVVGAGAIGSWTTLALAKMGCQKVSVIDFDRVMAENTASQIYSKRDIGHYKVDALADHIRNLTGLKIKTYPKKWEKLTDKERASDIVISAVDDIDVRKTIWNNIKTNPDVELFIDGRMAGELIRVFIAPLTSKKAMDYYERTLKPRDQMADVPCSERAVVFNVFVVAGLITAVVAQWANETLDGKKQEIIFDLSNFHSADPQPLIVDSDGSIRPLGADRVMAADWGRGNDVGETEPDAPSRLNCLLTKLKEWGNIRVW